MPFTFAWKQNTRPAPDIELLGFNHLEILQHVRNEWIECELRTGKGRREPNLSECLALGDKAFIDQIDGKLGPKVNARNIIQKEGSFMIREEENSYATHFDPNMNVLRGNNSVYLQDY